MIKLLEKEFDGIGEMKDFHFRQINVSTTAYLYELTSSDSHISYEVILRKTSPIYIDFEKRKYSDTDFRKTYPKSRSFSVNGWAFRDIKSANKKFKEI